MKGQWESNIIAWFPFMYSLIWKCYFQNRIITCCLSVPTLIYLWDIYIFPGCSAYSVAGNYVDRSGEYINRSEAHECVNWDWGRVIPRKGIHKWNFRCSLFMDLWFIRPRPRTYFFLYWQIHYEGKWEGVGPWKSRLFGALWIFIEPLGEWHLGPKKVEISRAQTHSTCPSNGFVHIKSITYRAVSIRGP
jgi:hypothetical protein